MIDVENGVIDHLFTNSQVLLEIHYLSNKVHKKRCNSVV